MEKKQQTQEVLHTNDMTASQIQKAKELFNSFLNTNETIIWLGVVHRPAIYLRSFLSLTSFGILLVVLVLYGAEYTVGGEMGTLKQPTKEFTFFQSGIVFFVAFILNLYYIISNLVKKFAITNKRIIFRTGIIGVDFQSYHFNQIRSKKINVGLIGILLKVGTLKIDSGEIASSGQNTSSTKFHSFNDIREPYVALKLVSKSLLGRDESLYSGRADYEATNSKNK